MSEQNNDTPKCNKAKSQSEHLAEIEHMFQVLRAERQEIGAEFSSVARRWHSVFSTLESRHQELEDTMASLRDLNEQLTESNAMLIELKCQADEAEARAVSCDLEKSLFLARMSHEIRSPLSVILGYADQILEDELDQAQILSLVGSIRKSGRFVLDVVNEVLDLSKIEAGAFSLSPSNTLFDQMVLETFEIFQQSADKKSLELVLDLQYPVPETLFMDAHRFKQVLINLLSNAVKFTEQGFVRLTVIYEVDRLIFEVRDSGIGMTEDQLQKIFQPYTQAEDSISSRFGGTGLGLYISKEIIEQMGGIMSATSEFGKGSCFRLELPVDPTRLTLAFERTSSLTHHKRVLDKRRFKGRVLVAEDTADLQIIIKSMLTNAGLDVTLANNGQQAYEFYTQNAYDIVLLDVEMPVLDGVSALLKIRDFDAQRGVHITAFALTAHALKEEIAKLQGVGFTQVVTKPFRSESFFNLLALYLDEVE